MVDGWFDASLAQLAPEGGAVIPLVRTEALRPPPAVSDLERIDGLEGRVDIGYVRLGGEYGKRQAVAVYQNAPF